MVVMITSQTVLTGGVCAGWFMTWVKVHPSSVVGDEAQPVFVVWAKVKDSVKMNVNVQGTTL